MPTIFSKFQLEEQVKHSVVARKEQRLERRIKKMIKKQEIVAVGTEVYQAQSLKSLK